MTMSNGNKAAIFITGAGRNTGAYMARRFIDAGYPVVAHYRTPTVQLEALADAGVQLVQGDFTDAGAIEAVAEEVISTVPRLRAIIHNASSFGPTERANKTAAEQFQQYYNVHMLTPFLLNRLLVTHLDANAEIPADIIHITDIYADNPAAEYDSYCATKAGSQNLALSAAKQWAPEIKVNVIQPGPISFQDWHDPAHRARVLQATPLAQTGGPQAIYAAAQAIIDNPFQTGSITAIDGGRRLTGY